MVYVWVENWSGLYIDNILVFNYKNIILNKKFMLLLYINIIHLKLTAINVHVKTIDPLLLALNI
jgi:hypothetical protein